MGTLNIINKSPFEKRSLDQCLRRIGSGDSVLLIEDAAISAVAGTAVQPQLIDALKESGVYVLTPDLNARGLAESAMVDGIKAVDYAGFVHLVVKHDRVHSWL